MACEACNVKFTLFTRKKQCMECLRHFCSECVIKRFDKMLSCESCSILSRRPLIRSQITQTRAKDLRQYLLAKEVPIKGCIEKEDLIKVLLIFADGNSSFTNTDNVEGTRTSNVRGSPVAHRSERKDERNREPLNERQDISATRTRHGNIEEVSSFNCSLNGSSEPMLSEEAEISTLQSSNIFTEIPVWSDIVKLSDINTLSELEHLSVKQLKNLLSINRVDYKGCIERCELLDRASRLWEQYTQSNAGMETQDENLCKICWDDPVECVILECGHMACCLKCGKQMSECPICKQYVVRVVRVFKA
ncbi:E3 ubiquitin-protein ligase RNF34 isoform X2 [Calliopsis andreniformis]|uniref:E3 ubiquitin-protein ligase RNF34 isoform X2 n=1 Tax=Calliopsis andreniformis TaxID=337506 RepID=UPI003FCE4CCC